MGRLSCGRTARARWRSDSTSRPPRQAKAPRQFWLWARARSKIWSSISPAARGRDSIDRRIEQGCSSRCQPAHVVDRDRGRDRRSTQAGRTVRIPQALPYGMSAEGLGLASAQPMLAAAMPSRLFQSLESAASFGVSAARSLFLRDSKLKRKADMLRDRAVTEAIARLRENEASRDELLARLSRLADEEQEMHTRLKSLLADKERLRAEVSRFERPAGPVVALRGRVFPTPGRPTATIEIVVTSGLNWRPEGTATLSVGTVDVVELGTTRPGPVVAGSLARLELAAAPVTSDDQAASRSRMATACWSSHSTERNNSVDED